jgi:hypothetical protein
MPGDSRPDAYSGGHNPNWLGLGNTGSLESGGYGGGNGYSVLSSLGNSNDYLLDNLRAAWASDRKIDASFNNGNLIYWTGSSSFNGVIKNNEMYGEYDLGVGHTIRLMDDDTVDNLNFINDRIGDFGSLLELTRTQGGSIAFWTTPIRSRAFDGITYSRPRLAYYRNNWGGNGYTGATTSVAKYIGKGALIGQISLGAIEIGNGADKDYNDYYEQGVTGGKNAVIASVKVTTGATMGYLAGIGAGMAYGAVMGSSFPIVGTIIGAIVGGVVGYYSSEFVGGLMEKNIQ